MHGSCVLLHYLLYSNKNTGYAAYTVYVCVYIYMCVCVCVYLNILNCIFSDMLRLPLCYLSDDSSEKKHVWENMVYNNNICIV